VAGAVLADITWHNCFRFLGNCFRFLGICFRFLGIDSLLPLPRHRSAEVILIQ